MNNPLVSVVIPCFNVAGTVAETVASVSAQTMTDFEIIAVDNNCSDNTAEILAGIAARETRLRVIAEPVQGLSAARNGGIRAARGRFIALLDADDLWDPEYLEAHLANLADGKAGISYARVRMIDVAGRPTGQVTAPKLAGLTPTDLLRSNPCTALFVVRADVFRKIGGFDETLRSVEDQEWLFRAACGGFVLAGMDKVLASYRIMPGGLSADLETMLRSHAQLLEAAARIAPDLVSREQRIARAAMLRYCARRAVEQGKGFCVAWHYLGKMLQAAPDLLFREPVTTAKVIARVLLSDIAPRRRRRAHTLPAGEA